jgi:hypothetical protein
MRRGAACGLVILLLLALVPPIAHAEIVAVSASVQPATVAPASTEIFSIELMSLPDNSGSISWVSVVRPSANFTLRAGTLPGWQTFSLSAERIVFVGDLLSPNQTVTMTIIAQAANVVAPAANWTVEVSENADGTAPLIHSTEEMATAIVGEPEDNSPPVISNISITKLTSSSATVSWSTDEAATSRIDYGTSSSYSSTQQDSTFDTSHSFILTGLAPDTTYHYRLTNSDSEGNSAAFGDNTFVTLEVFKPSQVQAVKDTGERVPPTIQVASVPVGSYRQAPKFSGSAKDNEAIARVDYSLDGGVSWRRVTEYSGLNSPKVTFTFQPNELEDGNYNVIARAIDPSGNVGQSTQQTLVIDLGPPLVGVPTILLGARPQLPDHSGYVTLPQAATESVVVAAVGGPTEITLLVERISEGGVVNQQYSLTRSVQTGLWRGGMSFTDAGVYRIRSSAVDGAGNVSDRSLLMVRVIEPIKVSIGQSPVESSKATIYVREQFTNDWVVWGGGPYGQQNPIEIRDGNLPLSLPKGRYYLSLRGVGHIPTHSQIFTVDSFTHLSGSLKLRPARQLTLGGFRLNLELPLSRSAHISFSDSAMERPVVTESYIGKSLVNFSLPTTTSIPTRAVDLLGKPTVMTFLNTWSPDSIDQLAILDTIASQPTVAVVPVVMLESLERVRTLGVQGGYKSSIAVDREGVLLSALPVHAAPTHVIVSRRGTIKRVVVGVLSKEMIMSLLAESDLGK